VLAIRLLRRTDTDYHPADLVAKLPECFAVIERGKPVRDVDLRFSDKSYPCRECKVEDQCAVLVGQVPWERELARRHAEAATRDEMRRVRSRQKRRSRYHSENYRKPGERPQYIPEPGTRTHWILLRILEARWSFKQMQTMLIAQFPQVKPYRNQILLRTMLHCFANRRHRQFIGKLRRPRGKGKVRFFNPKAVVALMEQKGMTLS